MNSIKATRWLSLIIGILFIISSVFSLLNPLTTASTLIFTVAYLLIAIGILKILRYFTNTNFKVGSFLVSGIIDILIGILIIKHIPTAAMTFSVLIGFWVFITGVVEIATSIDFKNMGIRRWWLGIISGIIGIILGYMLLADQAFAAIYVSTIFSIYMMVLGLSLVFAFFELKNTK